MPRRRDIPASVVRNRASAAVGAHISTVVQPTRSETGVTELDAAFSGRTSLVNPLWDAAFWPARYLAPSSWIEHIPFAFWLVSAVSPRFIVEVGTGSGVSYFAFCQAVEQLSLDARCCAVITHKGARGSRAERDLAKVKKYNDDHYSSFSAFYRCTPDEAPLQFDTESIDLLHLNLAGVDDAEQAVGQWLDKMSPSGILLLAGTSSAEGLAAQRALAELRKTYPAFEFVHGDGLAVIGIGNRGPAVLQEFLSSISEDVEGRWRKRFARLGRGLLDRHQFEQAVKKRGRVAIASDGQTDEVIGSGDALAEEVRRLRQDLATERHRLRSQQRDAERVKDALRDVRADTKSLKEAEKQIDALKNEIAEKSSALNRMGGRIAALKDEIRRSDHYVGQMRSHYEKVRARVERRLMSMVNQISADSNTEAVRTTVLRHEAAPSLKVLSQGVRASMAGEPRASRRSLYLHYRYRKGRNDAADLAKIAASGLFDPNFYLARNEDVARGSIDPLIHFVDFGAAEGRDPSAYFDTSHYLETYPDVTEKGVNPLLHFVTRGRAEGRVARPTPSIKAILGDWTPPSPPPEQISRDDLAPLPKRVVIYTAISGSYDDLKPPAFRPPHCDFVVFTDQPIEVEGWQVRPLNYLHPDTTRAARFVKLHPQIYFPDYEHSIWIDGNIGVHGDIREFFRRLKGDSFIGIFTHPLRDCIYVEAEECIKRKKDDPDVINKHVARYRNMGFPERFGLWETNVLVRRHNDPRCIALMTEWWREMEIGSRRDQLSLPVAVSRLTADIAPLGPAQVDARNHPMLSLVKHPPRREVDHEVMLPTPRRTPVDLSSISMDVGVCVYNSLEETRACLESVVAARRDNDRIVIVDDASATETADYLDAFAARHPNVKLVRHETNRGYTASANDVLKHSSGDWVVLLNSDAVVAHNSLRKMIECGEQFPQIGIVGALSNAASWQTVPQLTGPDGKFLVNQLPANLGIDDMDRICQDVSSGVVPFVPLINGFCYAMRRKLIETIGSFDEESFPQGYGEEDDFCLRAGAAGFLCAIATDAYVFHVKSATFTSDRRKPLVEAGVEALRRKHTPERLKAAVETLKRHPELRRIRARVAERLASLAPSGPGNDANPAP